MDTLRVALFTPLPPAMTGTADYASALVAELKKIVKLQVYQEVPRRFDPNSFDALVYQIANNPHHAPFYKMALDRPGVVVLHEPNLHDLVKGMTLNSGHEATYLREVVYEIFGQELEHVTMNTSLFQSPQPRTFTLVRRLLKDSTGCIVHSNYAERELRMKDYRGPVSVIPHGTQVRTLQSKPFRDRLGLAAGVPLIGLFGYQRPDKRTLEYLDIFSELRATAPDAHTIVVGQMHPEMDLAERLHALGFERHVTVLDYQISLEDFDGYLSACDIVVNLRNPTFGETSGTMMRAFGLGKAVVVSDNGANKDLPEDVCVRIPDDAYEGRVLLECLKWLLADSSLRSEIGSRAQAWVATHASWPKVAKLYSAFLESVARGTAEHKDAAIESRSATASGTQKEIGRYLERWIEPGSDAADYFKTHIRRLVRTLQLTPPGGPDDRILEMGCYFQITPALHNILGYGDVIGCHLGPAGNSHKGHVVAQDGEEFQCQINLFDAETDVYPYEDDYFSTVLCCELLEHLEKDPMYMLNEVHRVLKRAGVLLLTTPNIVSLRAVGSVLKGRHPASYSRYQRLKLGRVSEPGHAREYTPDEICLLLSEAGFVVTRVETGPYGDVEMEDSLGMEELLKQLKVPDVLRGDCVFAVARKETIPQSRYPAWLYGE